MGGYCLTSLVGRSGIQTVPPPMARLDGWPEGEGDAGGDYGRAVGAAPGLHGRLSGPPPRCPLAHGLTARAQAGWWLGRQGVWPPSACSG
jgi:hypothetical protein